MTIKQLLIDGSNKLKAAGIEDYESDAKLLLMHAFDISYTDLFMHYLDVADDEKAKCYNEYVAKRCSNYPCQYIIGTQDFMGYEFYTSENVLIPRPETEILVENAIKSVKHMESCTALDMCCGSGCIGISFWKLRNEKAHKDIVDLADISEYAIELTKRNVKKLNADCNIIKTDLFENINRKYDIILSNPPYIKSEEINGLMKTVKNYEPHLALDGGEDGLFFYNKIIREARNYLNENGIVIFEIGYDQAEDLRRLFVDNGFVDVRIIKDYADLDRIAVARMA